MKSYREVFSKKHTLLVVIHVEGGVQALRNARIAANEGVDGVFLINHHIPYVSLLECAAYIRNRVPRLWIGVNCLGLGAGAVEVIPKNMQGLWVDNAMIEESAKDPVLGARGFSWKRKDVGWEGLYFGGVAFKYQAPVTDLARVARLAMPFVDVITTSGPGTDKPADVGKIRTMKQAIGNHPLAIASGIRPENVREYMPYTDCFLVASGISDSHTELNPAKVRALVKVLRS